VVSADWQGKVLVVGMGRSGLAVARFLLGRGQRDAHVRSGSVTVVDENDTDALRRHAEELRALGAEVELGVSEAGVGPYDLAIVSPGLSPERPLMRFAASTARRLVSEIEFAYEMSQSPWVAVTGTNGKTTTTSLISHLLTSAGLPCETVGNIGRPAIEVVDDSGPTAGIVAEVSSFQLAFTRDFRPRVAVLLNVTPDHLDWHGGMAAYAADKAKVFANQTPDDTAVIDIDDEGSAPYASAVESRGVRVARVTRGLPPRGGAGLVEGVLVLDTPRGALELVPVDALKIRGEHNVSNALAAAAAAHAMGASAEAIRDGLRTFEPIEHRIEPVGDVAGVEYFNDSKATNPDAVLKALTAFGDRPLVVLLGGRNKGNDFSVLARAVGVRAKAAVLFGECRGELAEAFSRSSGRIALSGAGSMAEAFGEAASLAEPGDAVLLSPACASFDEFSGYAERGAAFRAMVRELEAQHKAKLEVEMLAERPAAMGPLAPKSSTAVADVGEVS
jgi:UDP-N-acetylmuramoylalanine--D-glutamate ligase